MKQEEISNVKLEKLYKWLYFCIIFLLLFVSVSIYCLILYPSFFNQNGNEKDIAIEQADEFDNTIENGIHLRTGLIEAEGLMTVVNNCTSCHSSKLITQNRMTAERWNETIEWMQETQNLWELGSNQDIIVNYLVTNYPPSKKGRRMVLQDIEWYELEE